MQGSFNFGRKLQTAAEQPLAEVRGIGVFGAPQLQQQPSQTPGETLGGATGGQRGGQFRAIRPAPQVLYTYDPQYLTALVGAPLVAAAQALLAKQGHGDVMRVNPKQYHAIMRRREQRRRADEKNQLVSIRRSYVYKRLHEAAKARARNSLGKFLPDGAAAAAGVGAGIDAGEGSGVALQQDGEMLGGGPSYALDAGPPPGGEVRVEGAVA